MFMVVHMNMRAHFSDCVYFDCLTKHLACGSINNVNGPI